MNLKVNTNKLCTIPMLPIDANIFLQRINKICKYKYMIIILRINIRELL